MIKKSLVRLLYGLVFALPLMIISYALAEASEQPQTTKPPELICPACHETFQETWETSAHAKSISDPDFKAAWEAQNSPGECLSCHATGYNSDDGTVMAEAITCQACHDTATANHPLNPMSADRSAKLCGGCHTETYFEWQVSAHRENGLDCIGCHDPHGTALKAEDAANQCASCHRTRASNFAHSEHSQQGLACANCHLAELPGNDGAGEGHARLDHSFNVRLSTCNECHAYQMHDPAEVHPENPTPPAPDAMAAVDTLSVVSEPLPVSPIGFATLAGLFGLAAGVIVGPYFSNRRKGG